MMADPTPENSIRLTRCAEGVSLPQPVVKKTTVGKNSNRDSIGSADRDTLVRLTQDLRAAITTSENHPELVARFLDVVSLRFSVLAVCWAEIRAGGVAEIFDSRFAKPSLDTPAIRSSILESAIAVAPQKHPRFIQPEEIRGALIIGLPFFQNPTTTAVLCLMVHENQQRIAQSLLIAQLVATYYDLWRSRAELNSLTFEVRSAATVLELVGKAECSESLKAASVKVANELQHLLRCQYVVVGYRKDPAANPKLMAISSMATFDHHSRATMLMLNAIDESMVRGTMCAYPPRAASSTGSVLAHKKLAQHLRCECAISIPLRNQDDELVGAVIVLGSRELAADRSTRNLIHALEHPVGSALQIVKHAEGGWLQKLVRLVVSREKTNLKWAAVASVLIGVIALFTPVSYRVQCGCLAQPVTRSYSVAPYEGLLETTLVEPGDVVSEGQVLARMDGREIRFKTVGLVAERDGAARKRDAFRANDEISDSIRADLERKRLETELALMQYREQNLEISSSIDGVVLSGSLDRRHNYPVTVGQKLFEIAPIDPLRVELAIPADEIMHVRPGQVVKFRFDGFGTESIKGMIARIRPSSTIRDDANVFVAEAILENPDGIVRPGMKGFGTVFGNRHTLGWTLFHRPWERFVTAIGL